MDEWNIKLVDVMRKKGMHITAEHTLYEKLDEWNKSTAFTPRSVLLSRKRALEEGLRMTYAAAGLSPPPRTAAAEPASAPSLPPPLVPAPQGRKYRDAAIDATVWLLLVGSLLALVIFGVPWLAHRWILEQLDNLEAGRQMRCEEFVQ